MEKVGYVTGFWLGSLSVGLLALIYMRLSLAPGFRLWWFLQGKLVRITIVFLFLAVFWLLLVTLVSW